MNTLKEKFKYSVGYSDHSNSETAASCQFVLELKSLKNTLL